MSEIYSNIKQGYNKIKHDINVGTQHYNFLSTQTVSRILEKCDKKCVGVLDAGCGNGYLLNNISARLDKLGLMNCVSLSGFDISNEMVERSINVNKHVQHKVQTLPRTDYEDKVYDIIILGEVLEHLYEPYASLMELRRILHEDGVLIITVPNGDRVEIQKVLSGKNKFQPADDVLLTYPELNYLFRKAGFRIIEMKGYGGVFPVLSNYSRVKKLLINIFSKLYLMTVDITRKQKQLYFVLKKDDYLLGMDY